MRFQKLCRYLCVPLAMLLGAQAVLAANPCVSCNCRERCQWHHCPPHIHHCTEKPPCVWFCCQCPRPSVCPFDNPNFGYFQPCWIPWPWPPDWSHCPVPPPASFIHPVPHPPPGADLGPAQGPAPRFDMRPGL